jgi:hypothetical protein
MTNEEFKKTAFGQACLELVADAEREKDAIKADGYSNASYEAGYQDGYVDALQDLIDAVTKEQSHE